jgi:hypothetical protein
LNGRWRSWKKFAGRKQLKLEPSLKLYVCIGGYPGFWKIEIEIV